MFKKVLMYAAVGYVTMIPLFGIFWPKTIRDLVIAAREAREVS